MKIRYQKGAGIKNAEMFSWVDNNYNTKYTLNLIRGKGIEKFVDDYLRQFGDVGKIIDKLLINYR